jgi:hypothetical protein
VNLYIHQTKEDQSSQLLDLDALVLGQIQHRQGNADETYTGGHIDGAGDVVEHDSRIDAVPRGLGQPALVDWVAGEHTHERGGGEEAREDDHEGVVDHAGEFNEGVVEEADEVAINKCQGELAKQ